MSEENKEKEDLKKAEAHAAEMLATLEVPDDALVGETSEEYKGRKDQECINQPKKA